MHKIIYNRLITKKSNFDVFKDIFYRFVPEKDIIFQNKCNKKQLNKNQQLFFLRLLKMLEPFN